MLTTYNTGHVCYVYVTGTVQGSVHLTTVENVKFTFAGFGEYVLLRSTTKLTTAAPVTVQMRTALTTGQSGDNSRVTVITCVSHICL